MARERGQGFERGQDSGGGRAPASVFHSQRLAEKSAKAFLTYRNIPFREVHDLKELGAQCVAVERSLASLAAAAADLNAYAVVFRYLDAPREPDEAEAAGALETARRLHDAVRELVSAARGSGQGEDSHARAELPEP